MDSPVVLGIDIGGTNTVYGFIGEDGHIYDHEEIPTKGSDPVTDLVGRIEARTNLFLNDNPPKSCPLLLKININNIINNDTQH